VLKALSCQLDDSVDAYCPKNRAVNAVRRTSWRLLETLTTVHPTTTQYARISGGPVPEALGIALATVPRRQFHECLREFAPPSSREPD
jgi:hypothetical protein